MNSPGGGPSPLGTTATDSPGSSRSSKSSPNNAFGPDDDVAEHVPTAQYVEGRVGLAYGRLKKISLSRAACREGYLVIELSDDGGVGRSGTVRFYTGSVLEKLSMLKPRSRSFITSGNRKLGGQTNPLLAERRNTPIVDRRRGSGGSGGSRRSSLLGAPRKRPSIDGIGMRFTDITVKAGMEPYKDPYEEPHLRIPGVVPWKFEALGDNTFQVLVPLVNGRMDQRVELAKPSLIPKKMKGSRGDEDSSVGNKGILTLTDSIDNGDGIGSPSKNKAFKFQCHPGELAVYAKAAQTLGRILIKDVATKKRFEIIRKQASRTRTEVGMEIAAQAALIARSRSVHHMPARNLSSCGQEEFRVSPSYCYPNTWMTKSDISIEVKRKSRKFHDMRNGNQDEIGSIQVEVLQCSGLPKLDRYGLSDAYCFIVCGSSTFVTDVIPENCNPCWLPLSRRACIMPIIHPYAQLYIGVFDFDGEMATDDFVGRVVIDIPQIWPGPSIDVTLPLRDYSSVYNRKKLGSIRLRLQLEWAPGGERAALLSYLPRVSDISRRFIAHADPVTVACPDVKSFYNVALTVYGKDMPGRCSKKMMIAATREVSLVKRILVYHAKRTVIDAIRWERPLLSFYLFCGWMYSVIISPAVVPAFCASLVLLFMLRNYMRIHFDSAAAKLYHHRTISEMTRMLLLGEDSDKFKESKRNCIENNPLPSVEKFLLILFGMSPNEVNPEDSDKWRFEDNAEFPFSIGAAYPKKTSDEAAAAPLWEAAQDEWDDNALEDNDDDSRILSDKAPTVFNRANTFIFGDSDHEHEEDFFDGDGEIFDDDLAPMKKARVKAPQLRFRPSSKGKMAHSHSDAPNENVESTEREEVLVHGDSIHAITDSKMKVRLPDQNMGNKKEKGDPINHQMNKLKTRLNKATFHLFDDRVFVSDRADAEKLLRINTGNNPVTKMINPFIADALKIFGVQMSAFRAIFNILYFKDPMLSYWVMVLVFILMLVVLICPWRKIFFIVGLLGLGPQNYFLSDTWQRLFCWCFYTTTGSTSVLKSGHGTSEENSKIDLSKSPLLMRNNMLAKPDGKLRQIIVPSAPFRYNRFYDWPPDPTSTTIKE